MPRLSEAFAVALDRYHAGQFAAAEEICRRILAADETFIAAWQLSGIIAHQAGRLDEAAQRLRRAIELNPEDLANYNNLGAVLKAQNRLDEAWQCFQKVIRCHPSLVEARVNAGQVLRLLKRHQEALEQLQVAIELHPGSSPAYNHLGIVYRELGRSDKALSCYDRALALDTGNAEAYNNRANVLKDLDRLDDALADCQAALALKPGFPQALGNQASIILDQGRLDEGFEMLRRAVDAEPESTAMGANWISGLSYQPSVTLAGLLEAHREWDRRHARSLTANRPPHAVENDLRRPLRLGFVSPDFGRHPVGYFLVRVLETLDRREWPTICYSDRRHSDDMTRRLQAAAADWRDTSELSDGALAQQIRDDRIDILFDLAGFSRGGRPLLFARKPAPIQIAWIGYAGTTGLEAMDYILADRYEIPPAAEPLYSERVLRMPDGYVCYDPPDDAPAVNPLPALSQPGVTFGSFNNLMKFSPPVLGLWSRILQRVAGSRLILKFRGLDAPTAAAHIRRQLTAAGIAPERIELQGWSERAGLLSEYQRLDLALDPFPYGGGLTTCEALWMGVPVITCPGETFASRHALSHLSSVGLTETVARDFDTYVEIAAALAQDLPRLAALRAGLRKRMAASALCDGRRFTANWTAILRRVWEQMTLV